VTPLSVREADPEFDSVWEVMKEAGETATDEARATLAAAGISAVFERHGRLLEQLPDGSIRALAAEDDEGAG
jgi:hypothetical protein